MGGLVESLMNLIAHDEEEGSYMAATRVGLGLVGLVIRFGGATQE